MTTLKTVVFDSHRTRIGIWRYLAATLLPLGLLYLSIFWLTLYLNQQIDLTKNEIRGAAAIGIIHDGVIHLQKIRGLSEILTHGGETDREELQSLHKRFSATIAKAQQRKYGPRFEVADEMAGLQKRAERLFSMPPELDPRDGRFQEYTEIIDEFRQIIRVVSDRSGLSVDPELSSHYMMELMVDYLPHLIEYVGRARGMGSGMVADGILTGEENVQFRDRLTAIKLGVADIENAFNIIFSATPLLKDTLSPLAEEAGERLRQFLETSESMLEGEKPPLKAGDYFQLGTDVIEVYYRAFQRVGLSLVTHQKQRLASQRKLRFYTVAGASLAALLIVYFISTFFHSNRTAFKRIEQLSITDVLTGLYNRRYLYQIFPRELPRARREEKSFAFGVLDVDYFKRYNDIYGHPEGDRILKEVATSVRNVLQRAGDFVFRIGGEEFCFLVTGMHEEEVQALSEHIRERVMALKIEHTGSEMAPYLTISIGLVYLSRVGEASMERVIEQADNALYTAKKMGRNSCRFEKIG